MIDKPELSPSYLGSNLRLLFVAYGLTQEEVGQRLGIEQSNVSRMLKFGNLGSYRPQLYHLTNLCEFFGTDLETLVHVDLVQELIDRVSKKSVNPPNFHPPKTP